jgi:LCP family protein required for cell wall assembly
MSSAQVARPRARSPFAAAFLSLLFPGLGHAYAGAHWRAIGFAAPPLLLAALVGGILLRMDRLELVGFLLQPWVLTSILVLDVVFLIYRIVATVDAYQVAAFLNAYERSGGRVGRPRLLVNPVSAAGLLAVLLVMAGGHAVVARYDLAATELVNCVFGEGGEADCQAPSPSTSPEPAPSDEASPEPSQSPDEIPSPSPGPTGTPVPNVTLPPWDGKERLNILLIGADEQEGGHNTDTLIVVSIDPTSRQVAMFSLPRDTVDVPIPPGPARNVFGSVYGGKINSWFVNVRHRADLFPGNDRQRGYNGLKAILGELYQLDIRYFVEVNFEGFERVVDALGGVTINVQIPVVDNRYPDGGWLRRVYVPTGVQHMNGEEALRYARSRNTSTDFDRGQRQQRVLLSLRQQTDIAAILPRMDQLIDAVKGAVRTDIPVGELPKLLSLADEIDTEQIRSYVFTPPRYQTEILRHPTRGYHIIPKLQQIRAAVKAAFKVDPDAEARREAIASEAAQVWVVDGRRRQAVAVAMAAYLESEGMTASAPNRRPPSNPRNTLINVYNGAEVQIPQTIAFLEATFEVKAKLVTDPEIRADVMVTTGTATPELTPPPAP